MELFVIYDSPRDLAPGFAVRKWIVCKAEVAPGPIIASGLDSLDDARALVPQGFVNLGRTWSDDPKICEVWT